MRKMRRAKMKAIYVRHGSTDDLERKRSQTFFAPLSALGRRQARRVALSLADTAVDLLVTSDMLRAVQTASEIARETGVVAEESPLFRERRSPTIVQGKSYDDPSVQNFLDALRKSPGEYPGIRHSDEENFYDLRARAIEARRHLEQRLRKLRAEKGDEEVTAVVVTHGGISTALLAVKLMGDDVSWEAFDRMRDHFVLSNTGVTTCEFDFHGDGRWNTFTLNDTRHLVGVTD
jgi:broad specificity phosphatase PhoE